MLSDWPAEQRTRRSRVGGTSGNGGTSIGGNTTLRSRTILYDIQVESILGTAPANYFSMMVRYPFVLRSFVRSFIKVAVANGRRYDAGDDIQEIRSDRIECKQSRY